MQKITFLFLILLFGFTGCNEDSNRTMRHSMNLIKISMDSMKYSIEYPLHNAAETGNMFSLKKYIFLGYNLNTKDSRGLTPLHIATHNDNFDMVEYMLSKGADPNGKEDNGSTPIFTAAIDENIKIMDLLIKNGADIKQTDNYGNTILHYSVFGSSRQSNAKESINFILSKGVAINAENKDGRTPLCFAAGVGKKDVMDLLISKGADIYHNDNEGNTLLHLAAKGYRTDEPENIEVINFLLNKGFDVNIENNNGETSIFFSLLYCEKNTEFLISKGGDLYHKNKDGRNALLWACSQGYGRNAHFIKDFLKRGLGINDEDKYGNTPLLLSVTFDGVNIKDLADLGADIYHKNKEGNTILHILLADNKTKEMDKTRYRIYMANRINELLLNKADINAKNSKGETPLALAIKNKVDIKIIDFLKQKGAHI